MKKLLLIALVSSAFGLPAAVADQIRVERNLPYVGTPDARGGEFVATIKTDDGSTRTFLTFCLEHSIYAILGKWTPFTMDPTANTGGGGAVNGQDRISQGTAWLYSQFVAGTLANYFDDRVTNAGLLQRAIWALEDEIAWDPSNPYLALVGDMNTAKSDYTGTYVRVVNPYRVDSAGNIIEGQSFLAVPDGGLTIALLGAALVGLVAVRRRIA